MSTKQITPAPSTSKSATTKHIFRGALGALEVWVDAPDAAVFPKPLGFAVVCHPHPLAGGNAQHKIPQLLAEIFCERGVMVYRPSFRGVGASVGEHDHGAGESADVLQLLADLREQHEGLPFYAAGFSFGAHVMARAVAALPDAQKPLQTILLGLPTGDVIGLRRYDTPPVTGDVLLLHGEQDEITLLHDVIAWATPQKLPITILPGANHFFTGYLKPLKREIERFMRV